MLVLRVLTLLLTCSTLAFAQQSNDNPGQLQPSRPRMIRISAEVLGGLVNHVEMPKYPDDALKAGTKGDVILKIVVDESGKIILVAPVEGESLLAAASIDALRGFRYRPYLLNGMPIRVESQVEFRFSLHRHGANATGKVDYQTSVPFHPEFRTGVVSDKGVLVLWPRKISGDDPHLPAELAGKSGSVYLSITIAQDGKVEDVKVLGGDSGFIEPVVSAVKQFVYEPQLVDGKSAAVTTELSFHFGSENQHEPVPVV
jgi:TonB family protein